MDLSSNSPSESPLENEPVSSTPLPENAVAADSHSQDYNTSEVSSAHARPIDVMQLDSGGGLAEALADESTVVEGEESVASPLASNFRSNCHSGSLSGENEQIGRPSSAPARTPTEGRSGPALLLPLFSPSRFSRPTFSNVPIGSHLLRSEFMNSQEQEASSPDIQSSTMEMFETDLSPGLDTSSGEQAMDQEDYGQPYYRTGGDCNRPSFHCSYCSYSTPSLHSIRIHGNSHPESKVLFKCNMCNFTTARKSCMKHHRRVQHRRPSNPAPPVSCEKCQFSTSVPCKMREHYSRIHNVDNSSSIVTTSMHMRTAIANAANQSSNRIASVNLDRTTYVDANSHSRALHAFRLSQPRGTLQFETDPSSTTAIITIPPGRINPSYSPSMSGMLLRNDNQHLLIPERDSRTVSNHLINNIMAPPRVPVTSTVTSLEYPARPSNPHRPDLNCLSPLRGSHSFGFRDSFTGPFTLSPNRNLRNSFMVREILNMNSQAQGDGGGVKVKMEPIDCDGDVTSSGLISVFESERGGHMGALERPRRDGLIPVISNAQIRYRPYEAAISRNLDQSDEIGHSIGDSSESISDERELVAGSLAAGTGERNMDHVEERETPAGRHHHLVALFKTETSSVGIQCSNSSALKSEQSLPTVTVAAAEHSTGGPHSDGRQATEERGIQCELLASPPRSSRFSNLCLSTDSEQHSISGCESRCSHCGITFEDEVLFTIHIGCHSHTDPFVCNVCGKKCGNKYGFYSHITRGHHL